MKKDVWQQDWIIGVLISIVFFLLSQNEFIQTLERTAYDFGVRSSQRDPGDQIVVIAIDDQSLDKLGRWPWPRDIIAKMIGKLDEAGAKVIGSTILMSENQAASASIQNLIDYVDSTGLDKAY